MSDEEDYSSGSDADYVPSDGEAVSEEENSGEEEDLDALHAEAGIEDSGGGKGKKRKKHSKSEVQARKRKGGIKLEGEDTNVNGEEEEDDHSKELAKQIKEEEKQKEEEKEKKRADDLWSNFLSDVGSKPKPKPCPSQPSSASSLTVKKPTSTSPIPSGVPNKVTITKEFDFAGEVVKITKDVDASSKEGQKELKRLEKSEEKNAAQDKITPAAASSASALSSSSTMGSKRPIGGLGSVLNKINRKEKMSTLDKSKLDWESFKTKEGISEELQIHNRGKQGYIERMQFLNRTDQRQFEIERDLRLGTSSKR